MPHLSTTLRKMLAVWLIAWSFCHDDTVLRRSSFSMTHAAARMMSVAGSPGAMVDQSLGCSSVPCHSLVHPFARSRSWKALKRRAQSLGRDTYTGFAVPHASLTMLIESAVTKM